MLTAEESSNLADECTAAADDDDDQIQRSRLDHLVDKDLLCPVCFQTLKDPFLTACGHSFCYSCISMHLSRRNSCPCCSVYLTSDLMYPNVLLAQALKKLVIFQSLKRSSAAEQLEIALKHGPELSVAEIDSLMHLLTERKTKAEHREAEENMEILRELLLELHTSKRKELQTAENDLKRLNEDLITLSKERSDLQLLKSSYLSKFSGCTTNDSSNSTGRSRTSAAQKRPSVSSKKSTELLLNEYEVLKNCYIDESRRSSEFQSSGLASFRSVLSGFSCYSKLVVLSESRHGQPSQFSNIVSSVEFDRDDEFFVTVGVSGHLRVFDYSKVVRKMWHPNLELQTRSKMSCVTWDNHCRNILATCDYDGIIKIWDLSASESCATYEEHEKRTWSVDYSPQEPSRLVSGGDDGKIKLWSKELKSSVLTIEVKANICSVKYNPTSNNLVVAASADHSIYYYDLRQTKSSLHVFSGHEKAVSYVKFMSQNELVSASTDGTLRLWDLQRLTILRTFKGHRNEKNFVGLSVNTDYIACGSETNEVFVYHKGITKPSLNHKFPEDECDDASFISAVCWKRNDTTAMLAANSQGTLRALRLAM